MEQQEQQEHKSRLLNQEEINRLVAEVKAEVAAEAVAADLWDRPDGDLGARAGKLRAWAAHEAVRRVEVARHAGSLAEQLVASMSSVAFMVTCQVIDQLLADEPAGDGPAPKA